MKYVIIIPDGAADHPLKELDGKTPFEAANKPHTDRLAMEGRQGTVATTPAGFPCGSDVCSMSLLGYDPAKYHKGRAPLESAALGIPVEPADWIFRVNFITVLDGKMNDHSAGHISSEEGKALLEDYAKFLKVEGMTLYPGVSYRNIMVDSTGRAGKERDWKNLATVPPHDVPGEPMKKHLPSGGADAGLLSQMVLDSAGFLEKHEVNIARKAAGKKQATHVWPWGQGQKPLVPSFESRFKLKGAMITAVDLLAGISGFIGWDRLDVPGQTSYHDNDYGAAGRYAIDAISKYDVVCVHVEAPDEASHAGDAKTKVAAIEAIDANIVGPIRAALDARGEDYRILLLPDHYTAVSTKKHDPTPVPFVIMGKRIGSVVHRPYSEKNSQASDLHIEYGHELMEYFLHSGLTTAN